MYLGCVWPSDSLWLAGFSHFFPFFFFVLVLVLVLVLVILFTGSRFREERMRDYVHPDMFYFLILMGHCLHVAWFDVLGWTLR